MVNPLSNATKSTVYASGSTFTHGTDIHENVPVKDIKALGAGTMTYTDNDGDSSTVPVLQGELLYMHGRISVTASDVAFIVYVM